MPVVGRRDQDGVHVFACKNLAVIAGGEDIRPPEFFAVGQAAVIAVGGGDKLNPRDLHRDGRVMLPLNTCADESELDGVIRRSR